MAKIQVRNFFLQTYLMVSAGRWWEKSHDQLRKEKFKNRCHHQLSTASHQNVTSKKAWHPRLNQILALRTLTLLLLQIEDQELVVANIYAHNQDTPDFFVKTFENVEQL